jgi:beta-N-acetylhexosaminidase
MSDAGTGTPSSSRSGSPVTTIARLTPAATGDLLDSIGRIADSSDVVIVAAYVRRVEGEGRVAVPQQVAAWIDSVAMRRPVIVVSLGNPYLIRQFPSVDAYVVTYGVSDDLERAAVRALLGQEAITGKTPVSLPGFFGLGAGLTRARADSTG